MRTVRGGVSGQQLGADMTFDELCRREKATAPERDQLAWMLAMMRARQTYEELRIDLASLHKRRKKVGQSVSGVDDGSLTTGVMNLVVEL